MSGTRDPEEERESAPEEEVLAIDQPGETLEEILSQRLGTAGDNLPVPAAPAAELSELEIELSKMKDRYVRKLAEFENFKKRSDREKSDHLKYALTDYFRDILPVLDNFERALAHAPGDAAADYHQGILMIYSQFVEILKKRGLAEVASSGIFDPNIHEAVVRVETDEAPPNTILEVLQKGYLLNDRLLRPAFVKVAGPKAGD